MKMMNCLRCGRETSGQYCDTCRFYETNDQCWRCRMYLPKVELQQWRGQTYCPYCIMDIRDEEKRTEEARGERARAQGAQEPGERGEYHGDEGMRPGGETHGGHPSEPGPFGAAQKEEYLCDKCRGDLEIVYVVADHKFCELCFNQQAREWKKSGKAPPHLKYRLKEDPGLLVKLIRYLKSRVREEWEKRTKNEADRKGSAGK
ncbi:MAG: hypothetical protein PHS02_00680 [Candidatus ainarchaeum sp.]|nr:hypothetical protein [Candidatus ainarchaeum sp.]